MNPAFFNPKLFLSIGGLLGFSLALISGLIVGNEMGIVLRDASIGCLIGAILLRWFLSVIRSNIYKAQLENCKDTHTTDDNPNEIRHQSVASN